MNLYAYISTWQTKLSLIMRKMVVHDGMSVELEGERTGLQRGAILARKILLHSGTLLEALYITKFPMCRPSKSRLVRSYIACSFNMLKLDQTCKVREHQREKRDGGGKRAKSTAKIALRCSREKVSCFQLFCHVPSPSC